jgi:formate dehydrogenase subunit gamma
MPATALRTALALFLTILMLAAGGPAFAQGGAVNPTASSVKEKQLLDALKPGAGPAAIDGRVSIPDKRSGNLIRPEGRDWRVQHQSQVPRLGMIAILGMLAAVTLFYFVRGKVKIESGRSGRAVVRFGFLDRFGHWLTALSFIALALSGLNLTFGKSIVLPIVGPEAFASLTQAGKSVHNYGGFAFTAGLILIFLLWVKDNFPHPRDIVWLAKGGGLMGFHVNAARFNAGQKIIFWAVILGGAGLAFTGFSLMFGTTDLAGLQWYTILHGLIAVILTAVIVAHIYIGSVGMEGAFEAMGSGKVDENWAKEHHSIWVDQMAAKSAKPAGKVAPAE